MTKERPQSLLQVISLIEPFKLMKNSLYLLFRVLKVPETITSMDGCFTSASGALRRLLAFVSKVSLFKGYNNITILLQYNFNFYSAKILIVLSGFTKYVQKIRIIRLSINFQICQYYQVWKRAVKVYLVNKQLSRNK